MGGITTNDVVSSFQLRRIRNENGASRKTQDHMAQKTKKHLVRIWYTYSINGKLLKYQISMVIKYIIMLNDCRFTKKKMY